MMSDCVFLELEESETHLGFHQFSDQVPLREDTGVLVFLQLNLSETKLILQLGDTTGVNIFKGHLC